MAEEQVRRGARYWVDSEGIIHGVETSGATLELSDAKEAMELIRKLAEDRKPGLLMDITDLRAMSREARAYFAEPASAELLNGVALVVRSHLSRVIGNFFLGLNKAAVRTRLFNDEREALAWLRALPRSDGPSKP